MQFSKTDATAISVSSLCLVHCLALPFTASALPLLGTLSEAEWMHRFLVVITVILAGAAFVSTKAAPIRSTYGIIALIGLTALIAGAFVGPLHDHETLLTICGALVVGGAHLFRWMNQDAY